MFGIEAIILLTWIIKSVKGDFPKFFLFSQKFSSQYIYVCSECHIFFLLIIVLAAEISYSKNYRTSNITTRLHTIFIFTQYT